MPLVSDFINAIFEDSIEQEVGIAGFTTFARVNNKTTKKNTVPITYLEDGSFLEEHIIREPILLSIEGNVSDVFIKPTNIIQEAKRLETTIENINQYLPERTIAQLHKIEELTSDLNNAIEETNQLIERTQQISSYVGFLAEKNNTNKFLDAMNGAYSSNRVIIIEMHDRTYKNMIITLFETAKNNESNSINFTIEAQEVRYGVPEILIPVSAKNPDTSLGGATESAIDKGVQEGDEVETSVLSSIYTKLVE